MSGARPRCGICLACRTVLAEGEACPGGRAHQTVSLAQPAGRLRLDDEVWGPDSRARQTRQAAKAGAGGAGIGGFFEGCSGCDVGAADLGGEAFLAVLAVVVAAGIAILAFFAIRALVHWIREKLERPKPHGAFARAPRAPSPVVAASGVVRGGTPMALPWAAGSVFGYAMLLYEARTFGGGAMLRDAATAGFEVDLDDGRVLRVPAGRIQVVGPLPRVHAERTRLEGVLGQIAPGAPGAPELFPFDRVKGQTIGPGDRIELLGEVQHAADASSSGGYRAHAGVLSPVGVPVLRVVRAGERIAVDDEPSAAELLDEAEPVEEEAARQRRQPYRRF